MIGDVPLAELAGALYPVQEALERAAAIGRLLRAADRNLADAEVTQISAENRFDAACKAIIQLAKPALQANGYRTLTSRPGHHMTMIQTLGHTIGLDRRDIITLDALRKQRNVADYSGDAAPESAVEQCIASARELRDEVRAWLKRHRPALVNDQGRGG